MSKRSQESSVTATERRISKLVQGRGSAANIGASLEELYHLGRETQLLTETHQEKAYDPYIMYLRMVVDGSQPLVDIGFSFERKLLGAIRAYAPLRGDLSAIVLSVEATCAPTCAATVLVTAAHVQTPIKVLEANYLHLKELAERVRVGKVMRASFDAALAMGVIASRLDRFSESFQYLYDASTYAELCNATVLRAAANAVICSVTSRISPIEHKQLEETFAVSRETVRREIPRLDSIIDNINYELVSQMPDDGASDADVEEYVAKVRRRISAPMEAYGHDALLSTDETSVAYQVKELREMSRQVNATRDDMITMIADLDEVLTNLAQERKRITAVAEERQELLDLAAHEIKNPLVSISILAGRLEAAAEAEVIHSLREGIQEQIDSLDREIRRFLLGSPERKDELFLTDARSNLSALLAEEWALLRVQRDEKKLVERQTIDDDVYIHVSETAARVVLRNLLSNAVRYSAAYGLIEVELSKGNQGVTFTVSNTTSPFSTSNHQHSSGRGLSLVDVVISSIDAVRSATSDGDRYTASVVFPYTPKSVVAER